MLRLLLLLPWLLAGERCVVAVAVVVLVLVLPLPLLMLMQLLLQLLQLLSAGAGACRFHRPLLLLLPVTCDPLLSQLM